jgi:hypothetical protein
MKSEIIMFQFTVPLVAIVYPESIFVFQLFEGCTFFQEVHRTKMVLHITQQE